MIVVTGASGLVGGNLVRALLAQGRSVRALVHRDRRALAGLDVETMSADLTDSVSLQQALRGAEIVYHLASSISISLGNRDELERVNVAGTRNVIEACLHNNIRRLMYFGSIHAYQQQPFDQALDEDRPLLTGDHIPPYERSKALAEMETRQASHRGLDTVILIPTAIAGPFDFRPSYFGDLVEGLNAGADDFLTKPFDAQVLRARLRVAERILGLEQRLAEQNHALRDSRNRLAQAYDRIQADLASAARIQRQMLPTSDQAASPFRAAWLFLPAAQVSGDSFNFFELTEELIGFYHLDVSGHGIPSALLSVSLSRSLIPGGGPGIAARADFLDPARFLADLHRQLLSAGDAVENFATIVYGTLEIRAGRVGLALAGHPYPIHVRQGGGIEYLRQGGLPVGMFPQASYQTLEVSLAPGERLILYSDGITECRNQEGEAFGDAQLELTIASSTQGVSHLTNALEQRLRHWRGPGDCEDDISLLVFERPPEETEGGNRRREGQGKEAPA